VSLWTAVGAGSAVTVTAAFRWWQSGARVVGRGLDGRAARHIASRPHIGPGSGAPSDSLTTVAANSVVSWVSGDWAAVAGARTYRSSATEQGYHTATGLWTHYSAYQSAASAGAQTYGMTAPTGQTYTMASIEIQDSGGAAPTTLVRPRAMSRVPMIRASSF
jgi:hypothetical protein